MEGKTIRRAAAGKGGRAQAEVASIKLNNERNPTSKGVAANECEGGAFMKWEKKIQIVMTEVGGAFIMRVRSLRKYIR